MYTGRARFVITEADAAWLVDTARRKAVDRGLVIATAVVDPTGHLVSFSRMDGAKAVAELTARAKAWTAVMLRAPSADYQAKASPGGGAFGLAELFAGRYLAQGGGVPISVGGEYVGAVGITGGTAEEDDEIAAETVAEFGGLVARTPPPAV